MEEMHRGIWVKLFKHNIVVFYGYDTTSSCGEALISKMMASINGSLEFTLSWGKDSNEWSWCLDERMRKDPTVSPPAGGEILRL